MLDKDKGNGQVIYYRMDVLWAYLASVIELVTDQHTFSLFTSVANLV